MLITNSCRMLDTEGSSSNPAHRFTDQFGVFLPFKVDIFLVKWTARYALPPNLNFQTGEFIHLYLEAASGMKADPGKGCLRPSFQRDEQIGRCFISFAFLVSGQIPAIVDCWAVSRTPCLPQAHISGLVQRYKDTKND